MTVKELKVLLDSMQDDDAIIDIASDEEGNSMGDISKAFAEGNLKTGEHVFTLYPENSFMPEERYHDEAEGGGRI